MSIFDLKVFKATVFGRRLLTDAAGKLSWREIGDPSFTEQGNNKDPKNAN